MSAKKVTRRIYSAEELYRLRGVSSQPKLHEAIENNDGEDAELLKEHVLRGSKSFAARSFRSRASGNSLRVPSSNKENYSPRESEGENPKSLFDTSVNTLAPIGNVHIDQIAPFAHVRIRPSPTPSLKKKKAEAIIQAHGSPQHVRVTAGGRIVPSEQSPLCHPRYGYSAIKANGGLIKFAPNYAMGKVQWMTASQDGFIAQDVNGRLCQIVNGTVMPLNEVNGALHLFMDAPNLNVSGTISPPFEPPQSEHSAEVEHMTAAEPSKATQIAALELEYSRIDRKLKDLEKTEVIHGRSMGIKAKDTLFNRRRELVTKLDQVRKSIKAIKSANATISSHARQHLRSQSMAATRIPAMMKEQTFLATTASSGHQFAHNFNSPLTPVPYEAGSNASRGLSQLGSHYSFAPVPPLDSAFEPPVYNVRPSELAGAFQPGDMLAQYLGPVPVFQDSVGLNTHFDRKFDLDLAAQPQATKAKLPQTDGAYSISEHNALHEGSTTHSFEKKIPETRQKTTTASTLNPMSPAYRPDARTMQSTGDQGGSMPYPELSNLPGAHSMPRNDSMAKTAKVKAADSRAIPESPSRKSPPVNSSSNSSIETADFFPRNTLEYSTRIYSNPFSDEAALKENNGPFKPESVTASTHIHKSDLKPTLLRTHVEHASLENWQGGNVLTPPSKMPEYHDNHVIDKQQAAAVSRPREHVERLKGDANTLTNHRPQQIGVQSIHPDITTSQLSRKPDIGTPESHIVHTSPNSAIDLSGASTDWIEGYRCGLSRKAVSAERDGEFLDGYCAGLLKSKSAQSKPSHHGSNSNQTKARSARTKAIGGGAHIDENDLTVPGSLARAIDALHNAVLDPSHSNSSGSENNRAERELHELDSRPDAAVVLKNALFAPENVEAALSPTADGPHVNEYRHDLGKWARDRSLLPTIKTSDPTKTNTQDHSLEGGPNRSSSERQLNDPKPEMNSKVADECSDTRHQQVSSHNSDGHAPPTSNITKFPASTSAQSLSSLSTAMPEDQASSLDGASHRFSSMTSIDANIHRAWPAPRVFSPKLDWQAANAMVPTAGLSSGLFTNLHFDGTYPAQRGRAAGNAQATAHHSRFREGSIDGITNPPNSPQSGSPPSSPSAAGKAGRRSSSRRPGSKKGSPSKPSSPARTKFEHMAEKVGIKVSTGTKAEECVSSVSPSGKRRWRDVWRASSRKDTHHEDN